MEDSSHSSLAKLSSDHGHQSVFLERSPFERNIESGNREALLLVYLTAFLLMFQSQRESSIRFGLREILSVTLVNISLDIKRVR